MIRELTGSLGAAVERRLRDCLLGGIAATAITLFAAVSLAFGTFAAYVYFRTSDGRVIAALIVSAAYGLLAIAIWAIGVARRRSSRLRRVASASGSPGNIDALLQALGGTPQEQLALAAALRLGGELSAMQLLALALIGGFVAGRKIGK
jgi:hypothetical protein